MSQLPYQIKKEDLEKVFERYGPIKELHLPMTAGRTHAKGFGKIVFSDRKNAHRASVQMQGYVMDNMPMKLVLGTEMEAMKDRGYDVVMLKNLAYDVEEEEIMKVMRPYQALRIGLPRSPIKKECLGYGYVRFASVSAAEKALKELKNVSFRGRRVRMYFAEPKDHEYRFIV